MNKKVIEYFDRYLGGQLNEETSDEQLNRAAIDLVILTETVIKFVELNEISHQLARKVFLARRAIAKNIRPDAYTGRSYTNQQIARKNKELIQRSPEGKKLIRKGSAEHLKNLQQKVMSRKPFGPSPTATAAERADAKSVGIKKLKKAAKSARTLKPTVQVDSDGMPLDRSSTPKTLFPASPTASTPKPKKSTSERIGEIIGAVANKEINPLQKQRKSISTKLRNIATNLKKGYSTKVEGVDDSTRREEEEESSKSDPTGYISTFRRQEYEPIRKVKYPGSSTKQLGKDNVFQSQIGTGMHGKTIRGKVDRGPSISAEDPRIAPVERETQSAASNVDDVISSLPRRDREKRAHAMKMGQIRLDFDHPKPQEKKEKSQQQHNERR